MDPTIATFFNLLRPSAGQSLQEPSSPNLRRPLTVANGARARSGALSHTGLPKGIFSSNWRTILKILLVMGMEVLTTAHETNRFVEAQVLRTRRAFLPAILKRGRVVNLMADDQEFLTVKRNLRLAPSSLGDSLQDGQAG
jgi:hypothetical protein